MLSGLRAVPALLRPPSQVFGICCGFLDSRLQEEKDRV